jgi:TPR repeat protein
MATPSKLRRRALSVRARGGDVEAQFELAQEYDYDPPKDRRRAAYWYGKAAERGHAGAQNDLGEFLRDEKRNYRAAVPLFRRAAEQGIDEAQVSLGFCIGPRLGSGIRARCSISR